MPDFFETLRDPDMTFLRYALLLGCIASVPLGAVGTFVVARRISYLAAAIAHAALGGIGLALYCREALGWSAFPPLLGAMTFALGAAGLVAWISLHVREREDAAIGTIWVVGMALGLVFISLTPGYNDPMAYLFGDILLIRPFDLWLAGGVGLIIAGILWRKHRQISAVCFDPEFAASRGLQTDGLYCLLLLLTALTVVVLVSLVGIVLVIALLTLPPAIAALRAQSLGGMLAQAILLNLVFIASGLYFSFNLGWPTGPTIVLISAATYVTGLSLRRCFA
jgi:zinc transport system permease protein